MLSMPCNVSPAAGSAIRRLPEGGASKLNESTAINQSPSVLVQAKTTSARQQCVSGASSLRPASHRGPLPGHKVQIGAFTHDVHDDPTTLDLEAPRRLNIVTVTPDFMALG